MRRLVVLSWVAAVALVLVACSSSQTPAAQAAEPPPAADSSPESGKSLPTTSTTSPPTSAADEPATEDEAATKAEPTDDEPTDPVAVVIRAGGVDDEFLQTIQSTDGVLWVSMIETGQLRFTSSADGSGQPVDELPSGFVIQLEARAYPDLGSVNESAPELAEALSRLGQRDVALSESSAALRRLDVGSTITFENGASHRVATIVPDAIIGSTEVVLVGPDALAGAGGASSSRAVALVGYTGTGDELETELLASNGGEGIRVFGGRDNSQDQDRQRSTLSQIEVKEIFGEFAFRPRQGSAIEIDPVWTEANLVTTDIPLLGSVKCHRLYADLLRDVMQGLVDDGLADVIDPGAFQGCWNPRTIAGSTRLSRHAWGIAADINFGNPLDDQPGSPVHPELLRRMVEANAISGHVWTTPDPGHFEYRGP